jgi:hypothetical protein
VVGPRFRLHRWMKLGDSGLENGPCLEAGLFLTVVLQLLLCQATLIWLRTAMSEDAWVLRTVCLIRHIILPLKSMEWSSLRGTMRSCSLWHVLGRAPKQHR